MKNFHRRKKGIRFRSERKQFQWRKGILFLLIPIFALALVSCVINGIHMYRLHKQTDEWEKLLGTFKKRENTAKGKTAELSGTGTANVNNQARQENVQVVLDDSALFMGDFFFDAVATSNQLPEVSYLTRLGLGVKSVWQQDAFQTGEGKRDAATAIRLLSPKALFLMIGLHDLQSVSVTEIIQDYKTFLVKVQMENPDMVIILVSIPPVRASYQGREGDDLINQSVLDSYNEAQEQLAESMGICYLDAAQDMKDASGYLNSEYAETDGQHWTRKGCMKFVEIIKESDYIKK